MGNIPKRYNQRHKMFVKEYVRNGLNGTQAAIAAGYSKKTANVQAHKLLTYPYIQKAVKKQITDILSKKDELTIQMLEHTLSIATFDLRKAAVWDGDNIELRDSQDIDDKTAYALQEVSVKKTSTDSGDSTQMKIKAYDKNKALELLAKYLGVIGDGFDPSERNREDEKKSDVLKLTPQERRDKILKLYGELCADEKKAD